MSATSQRVLLRDWETGYYYKNPNSWVANPNDATNFESDERAIEERKRIHRANLDLVALDERGKPRFSMRLPAEGH